MREQLNALPDLGQEAHVVIYTKPNGPERSPWDFDPNGKPHPTREETLAYIQERLQNVITDPEENARAEAELAELHENLNRNMILRLFK